MFSLDKLKEIFDENFAEPFVREGIVETKWIHPENENVRFLELRVGPRDIWLDENGDIVSTGTDFTKDCEMVEIPEENRPVLTDSLLEDIIKVADEVNAKYGNRIHIDIKDPNN